MKTAELPSIMTPPSGFDRQASRAGRSEGTQIGDYIRFFRRHFRFLLMLSAGACLLMGMVSLFLTKYYESTATLLPQIEGKEGGGLGALLAAGGSAASQSMGIVVPGLPTSSTDIFIAILKSRVMADDVIRQFNLLSFYQAKTMQDARDALEAATRITLNKEKVIKITVEAKDPQLAADMANFYASNLDRLNRTLNVSKAAENRKFLERHMAETQVTLQQAEESLRDFQTKNRTVAVETQAKAMIEAVATLQGQIAAQEVQLQVMATYLSPDNPEFSRVRSGIEELRRQVRLLELGKREKAGIIPERQQHGMTQVPAWHLSMDD